VQDKIVCYICIDLHDVMYVFLYLYVMTLSFNAGTICAKYILIVFIYLFILAYLYCPIEQSDAINTWQIDNRLSDAKSVV
jgi:hypothetical protein